VGLTHRSQKKIRIVQEKRAASPWKVNSLRKGKAENKKENSPVQKEKEDCIVTRERAKNRFEAAVLEGRACCRGRRGEMRRVRRKK